jgi:hypothetical protein
MQSKEFLDEMSEYVSTHDTREELKNFPFRKRLEKEFGDEAGKRTFKYGCLSCGFENHFGRIYKHYSIGIDTENVLNDELSGKIFPFTTDNPADIAALVKLNGSWLITVDDFQPDTFCYDIKRAQSIKVNPNGVIHQLGKVSREFQALNMINMAVEAMFKEQKIPDDMLESVYKLSLAGKRFANADISRLAALWLWDKAHEEDQQNPIPFKEVYPILKAKLNDKKRVIAGDWDQQDLKANRIRKHYTMTDYCIQHHTITHLNK